MRYPPELWFEFDLPTPYMVLAREQNEADDAKLSATVIDEYAFS